MAAATTTEVVVRVVPDEEAFDRVADRLLNIAEVVQGQIDELGQLVDAFGTVSNEST